MYEEEYVGQSKSNSIDTSYPDHSITPFLILLGSAVSLGSFISIHAIISFL